MSIKSVVVLLHGIGRTRFSMRKMERRIKKAGYRVVNIDYPSLNYSIEALATKVNASIMTSIDVNAETLHIVTHSLGGLVARAWIAQYHPAHLGKVVMLSPPSQGSEVADFLRRFAIYRWIFGPAGQQLTTTTVPKLQQNFGPVDFPLGIIAGDRTIDPISSILFLPKHSDGKVTVERTKLAGMRDHITLHTSHAFIMRNNQVIDAVLEFLAHGSFRHQK